MNKKQKTLLAAFQKKYPDASYVWYGCPPTNTIYTGYGLWVRLSPHAFLLFNSYKEAYDFLI